MTVPGTLRDGGWAGHYGPVSFYRRFGRPSNLDAAETVRLVFEGVNGAAEVWLNDERLGTIDQSASFDVTARLIERNILEVIIDAADQSYGIVGEVVLEISVP